MGIPATVRSRGFCLKTGRGKVKTMTLHRKLFLSLLLSVLVTLGIGLLAYEAFRAGGHHIGTVEYNLRRQEAVREAQVAIQQIVVILDHYLITGDLTDRDRFADLATKVEETLATLWSLKAEGEVDRALLAEIRGGWRQFRTQANVILALPEPVGNVQRARLATQVDGLARELIGDLKELDVPYQAQVAATLMAARALQRKVGLFILLFTFLLILGQLVFARYLSIALIRPLNTLAYAAQALGRGNLDARVAVKGNDELAYLGRAFNVMAESLQRRLTELHALSEVSRTIREVTDRQALFADLTTRIARLLDAEQCAIVLRDEASGNFRLQWPAHGMTREQAALGRFPADLAATLLDHLPTDEVLIVNDPTGTEGVATELTKIWGERSLLIARLQVEDRVLGGIRVANKRSGEGFTQDDARLLDLIAGQAALVIEKFNLYQQQEANLQRRRAESEALSAIATAAVTASDLEAVLETALDHLLSVLEVEAGAIYLPVEDAPRLLRLAAQRGLFTASATAMAHLPADEGLIGQIYRTGEPIVLEGAVARPEELSLPPLHAAGCHFLAAVPLRFRGEVRGVLGVGSRQHRAFSQEDLAFLAAAGDQLGNSVENTRLRREADRHLRKIGTLAMLAERLNRTASTSEVVGEAIEALIAQLGLTACWFLVRTDDPSRPFALTAARHLPPALQTEDAFEGTCLCQTMALRGELTEAVNVLSCERLEGKPPEATLGLYYHATVPVYSGGDLAGLLNLGLPQGRHFDPDDLNLLNAAAETLGVALERARLHEQIKAQRLEEQETLLRLSQTLVGLTEPHAVMEATAQTVQTVLEADYIALMMPDPTGRWLVLVGGAGWEPSLYDRYRVEVVHSREGHAFRHQEPIQELDVRKDGPFPCPVELLDRGVVSSITVPLRGKGGTIGTLSVYTVRPRHFSADEVRLLSLIANHAAMALERAWAHQAVRAGEARYRSLNAVIAAAVAASDLSGLLNAALDHLLQALGLEMGAIWVDDQHSVRGLPPAIGPLSAQIARATGLELITPIAVEDWLEVPEDDPLAAAVPLMIQFGLRASLVAPIAVEGRCIGGLSVVAPEPRGWTPEEIALVEAVGQQLGSAAERLRLLARTREQARQVQQIMDTVPEGMILLDAEQRLLLANPTAQDYLALLADVQVGAPLTHLGGRPFEELLAPPPMGMNCHEVAQDGRIFEVVVQPIEADSEAAGWVLVLRDVTREREVQQRLQTQDRLAAVGQLAAGIAHDFNNILAVMTLYTQMALQSPQLPPKAREHLTTVAQQAERAADLIQQILDFSRRSVMEPRPLALVPFLQDLVKLLQGALPEMIQVELTYGSDDYTVNADTTRLQQVFMNLAFNARDAMPEGGVLRIGLERVQVETGQPPPLPEMPPGEWVRVTVTDTGVGIPSDVLPRIFEPFFTTKPLGQGTGLGLAQVYGIVKQHGGYIHVESRMGQGTTFALYLPALPTSRPGQGPSAGLDPEQGRGEMILVVEDDDTTRRAMVEILEMLNYRVLEAANGQEALEVFDRHSGEIALVLSDLVMPEMGGRTLFQALRQRDVSVKIVVLTGHPLGEEMEGLRAQGVVDWVQKPFSLEELADVVARAL